MVATFALGRVIPVLPFIAQARFYVSQARLIGNIIFAAGLVFSLPAFRIKPFTGPDASISLQTKGFMGLSGIRSILASCLGAWVGL
jgi:hypothetical protein